MITAYLKGKKLLEMFLEVKNKQKEENVFDFKKASHTL